MKKSIEGGILPKTVGPYTPALVYGNMIYCSGQIGKDPKTDKLRDGIDSQTEQIFSNLKDILKSAGSDINNVLKVTVYIKNLEGYAKMNKIYEKHFKKPYPVRTTVGVTNLPAGSLIEIDCIAYKNFHHDEHDGTGCCGECC